MNIASIICVLIIATWLAFAIRYVIKHKDSCSCGCSCGCHHCNDKKGSCTSCH